MPALGAPMMKKVGSVIAADEMLASAGIEDVKFPRLGRLTLVLVAAGATVVHMARNVSIRELRNSTSGVISELEAGERLTLTVNRRPVADILPHVEQRDPWIPSTELRRIVREAPADPGLLEDLADIRGDEISDA